MRNAIRRLAPAAAILLVSLAPVEAKDRKDEKAKLLTRSIYLPVEFKLCDHLRDAILFEEDKAVASLPARRIFQFTYYPTLNRIEPSSTDVRVEGLRADGEDFLGLLAVTPWGVFTATRRIDLDMDEQLAKMRFKLDVRYETLTLRMTCQDSCDRVVTIAAASPSGPTR